MPAQVAIEVRKRAKGLGALPRPLCGEGWSVWTVKPSKWASTRSPPGKLSSICMLGCYHPPGRRRREGCHHSRGPSGQSGPGMRAAQGIPRQLEPTVGRAGTMIGAAGLPKEEEISMSDLVFKRVIPAPAEEVFYVFSTEQGWRDWLCNSARFRPLSGRNFQLSWDGGWFAAGSILTLERPHTVELSWHGPGDPANSRVSVRLQGLTGGTEVEIRHTGLGEGEAWERARAEVQKGWEMGLENLESIFKTGEDLRVVRRPMLGIMMNDFTPEIAAEIGVPVSRGVRIDRALEGMGAERAGLQHDDVVVG